MKSHRTAQLKLAPLDGRIVPAVQVNLTAGTLHVVGDGQSDHVIVRATPGDVSVQGVNGTVVTSKVAATAKFTHLRIDLGGGDDTVRVENSWVAGQVTVNDALGGGVIELADLYAGKAVVVNAAGTGPAVVTVNGVQVGGGLNVRATGGSLNAQIHDSTFGHLASVSGGNKADIVMMNSVTAAGISVSAAAGDDTVTLSGLTAHSIAVAAGSGNDSVAITDSWAGGVMLFGNGGDDAFTLTSVGGIRLTVDGGAGSDSLTKSATQFKWSFVRNLTNDVPPVVKAIDRADPSSEVTSASGVTFHVTFNESVTGVDATDFVVTSTGKMAGTVTGISQLNDTVYAVTISGVPVAGTGTLGLNLVNDGSIRDATNVSLKGGTFFGPYYTYEVSPIDAYMKAILDIVPDIASEPNSTIYQNVDSPTVQGALQQVAANWGRAYDAASAVVPVAGLEGWHAQLLAAVQDEQDAALLAASLTEPDLPNTGENYNARYHYPPDTGYARADRLRTRVELIYAAQALGYTGNTPFGAPGGLVDKPAFNTPETPVNSVTLTQSPLDVGGKLVPNFSNFEYDTIYADTGDFTFTFVNNNPSPFVFNIALYSLDGTDTNARVTVDNLIGQTDAFQGAKTHVLIVEDLTPGTYVFVDNVHPTEMRGLLIVS